MAGRYQGCHEFGDDHGEGKRSVEILWHNSGWFWRPRQCHGDVVGPFMTSTQAYKNAKAAHGLNKSLTLTD